MKKGSVTELYLTLCDPMDCGPPDSSVRGILQARILEWVAMPSSRSKEPWLSLRCELTPGQVYLLISTQVQGPGNK